MERGDWIKSTDPRTGRVFYANKKTRQTQWEEPADWKTEMVAPPPPPPSSSGGTPVLPDNWEVMHDEATGRAFYVDHVNKVTTWEHPGEALLAQQQRTNNSSGSMSNKAKSKGTATGFGFAPEKSRASPSRQSSSSSLGMGGFSANTGMGGAAAAAWTDAVPPPTANGSRGRSGSVTGSVGSRSSSGYYNRAPRDESSFYYSAADAGSYDSNSALPPLDFSVIQVRDELRQNCPSCDLPFTMSKRRHHCRLCGDVFCDACSSHRCLLPLDGPQFERPVRVCDHCKNDVDAGNYFSMRRYLTVLQLFDPDDPDSPLDEESQNAAAPDSAKNKGQNSVAAALSALSGDLDSVLLDPSTFKEKVNIEPQLLIPAITRHLFLDATSDRAIRALASLLALASVVGDHSYGSALYNAQNAKDTFDAILTLLEWSGSSRRTLAVQEQAARTIYYLSDISLLDHVIAAANGSSAASALLSGAPSPADQFDLHRALRNMLDHATTNASPSLQRWAAACIRNLVGEDRRRACGAAARAASEGSHSLSYESFASGSLVNTGGIMILCSLIGSEDSDTRAHATAALSATIQATRDVHASVAVFQEVTGGNVSSDASADASIVRGIVNGGGCGTNLAQLLLSADNEVAAMGCSFASSLVLPILTNPRASSYASSSRPRLTPDSQPDHLNIAGDGLGAYREAALALATRGGCLAALTSLLMDDRSTKSRPIGLKKSAMEVLAAVAITVAQLSDAGVAGSNHNDDDAYGTYDEVGDDDDDDNAAAQSILSKVRKAKSNLETNEAVTVAFRAVTSASSQSLVSDRDSSSSQLREAAGLVLGSLTTFSDVAFDYLLQKHALKSLVHAASEDGMTKPSSLRGDWAPKLLGIVDTIATILMRAWKRARYSDTDDHDIGPASSDAFGLAPPSFANPSSGQSPTLDLLLECIDAGTISLCSKIVRAKIDFQSAERAVGGIRMKVSSTFILSAMFGMAKDDQTSIGSHRLYDAIDDEAAMAAAQRSSRRSSSVSGGNLISVTLSLLQSAAAHGQPGSAAVLVEGPLHDLTESCLLAAGSMCGSSVGCFPGSDGGMGGDDSGEDRRSSRALKSADFDIAPEDDFTARRRDACSSACSTLLSGGSGGYLPPMLVGVYGEGSVIPALRLALAIAQNGTMNLHPRLGQSGVLVPVADILRNALAEGDRYKFSAALALVRFCGPHVAASSGDSGSLSSLTEVIRAVTTVLRIADEEDDDEDEHPKRNKASSTVQSLKTECILTVEALSSNASLWKSIASDAVPAVSEYLLSQRQWDEDDEARCDTLAGALRIVRNVIRLPSHVMAVSKAGVAESLVKIICGRRQKSASARHIHDEEEEDAQKRKMRRTAENDIQRIALEILHALSSQTTTRRGGTEDSRGDGIGDLHRSGAISAVCAILGTRAIVASENGQDADSATAAAMTKLGLEILHNLLSDIENPVLAIALSDNPIYNAEAVNFAQEAARHPNFIRALCATMMLADGSSSKPNSKNSKEGRRSSQNAPENNGDAIDIAPLYGRPLAVYAGACAGYRSPLHAATSALFSIAAMCSCVDSAADESFWETFLLEDGDRKLDVDPKQKESTAAAASAVFLNLLMDAEEGICVPRDDMSRKYYLGVSLPLVRSRLFECLNAFLSRSEGEEKDDEDEDDDERDGPHPSDFMAPPTMALESPSSPDSSASMLSLLLRYRIPQACVSLCGSPALLDPAFRIVERSIFKFPEEIIPTLITEKAALRSVLDMFNRPIDVTLNVTTMSSIRRLIALILAFAAERNFLGQAVDRLGLRSRAIASISMAFLVDDDEDEEVDVTNESGLLSQDVRPVSLLCLHALVGIFSVTSSSSSKEDGSANIPTSAGDLRMTSAEAKAVADSLGKKISDMVVRRFANRTEIQNDEDLDDEDEEENLAITAVPEVMLLCALASNREALPGLCRNGGLQALSAIATEGELSAIDALHAAARQDPKLVLEVEGHVSVMHVLIDDKTDDGTPCVPVSIRKQLVDSACLHFLATLCRDTPTGREAVAAVGELCDSCVALASGAIGIAGGDDKEEDKTSSNVEAEDSETALPPPPSFDVAMEKRSAEEVDPAYLNASYAFLTELVKVNSYREMFQQDSSLLQATAHLASKSPVLAVQYAAVSFLTKLAPFVGNCEEDDEEVDDDSNFFTASSFASMFLGVLEQQPSSGTTASSAVREKNPFASSKISKKRAQSKRRARRTAAMGDGILKDVNRNMLIAAAVSGLECVWVDVSENVKSNAISVLSAHFIRLVGEYISGNKKKVRSANSANEESSGLVAHTISFMFVLSVGSNECHSVLQQRKLLLTLFQLLLVHCNNTIANTETNKEADEEAVFWASAITNILQCLAVLVRKNNLSETSWSDLIHDAEQAAGRGRTRKFSIETISEVLVNIQSETGNACAAVAAKRISKSLA